MYLLETVYPFALAGANMCLGWILYRLFKPVFGGLLVLIGLLVLLTMIGSTVSEYRPARGKST